MGYRQKRGMGYVVCVLSFLMMGVLLVVTRSMATHSVTKTEDVRNTKHYFIGNPDTTVSGTTEVCIFCHTPHGANPNVAAQAPLWNRFVRNVTDYDPYLAPNTDALNIPINNPGFPKGVSLGCLSCHDGSIAMDALINSPGSGGFLGANRAQGGSFARSSIVTVGGPGIDPSDGTLLGDKNSGFRDEFDFDLVDPSPDSPFAGGIHDYVTDGTVSDISLTPFPNLTLDLSDDHPVGIQVPADNFTLSGVRDPQFVPIGANSPPPAIDGVSIKFITRSAGILPNDIRDRLRAYPFPGQAGNYYIECASCHNPHTPRVNFLRLPSYVPRLVEQPLDPSTTISDGGIYDGRSWAQFPNNGSAICLSCHAK